MFSNLKTSSRIALRFSWLTALLLIIFWFIINLVFFWFWVSGEQRLLKIPLNVKGRIQLTQEAKEWLREYFQDIALIDKDKPLAIELLEEDHLLNIMHYGDNRYMYKELADYVVVRDVTRPMEHQLGLIRLSIILLILCTFTSYLLGKRTVRHALRDLDKLVEHVKQLNVRSLSKPLELSHLPANDELRVVTDAINVAHQSLFEQIELIKRFVSHASHELKTPLMIMQTDSELALKAKKYQAWLEKNLATIDQLNRLLEALLLLTRGQQDAELPLVPVPMARVISEVISQVQKATHKEFTWDINLDQFVVVQAHQGIVERIVINLVENAVKYTPNHGTISIVLKPNSLVIHDSGEGISAENIWKIREPFWQADSSKGKDSWFGLWLSLVHHLVKLMHWNITVESTPGKWTTFIVYFK